MCNETLTSVLLARDGNCHIEGNPDLYGLGIRVGIYIQMITVQISAALSQVLREEDRLNEATVVFVISVSSVLFNLIYQNKIEAVEAAPVLVLLLAQVHSCRLVNTRGIIPTLIFAVELLGLVGLYVWYWWYGMDTLKRTCPDDKAFFFAKVSIWGWFRTMNKVLTVFTAIYGAMAAIMYIFGFGFYAGVKVINFFARRTTPQAPEPEQQEDRDRFEPGDFPAIEFIANVGVIVFVEMTLKWNNIPDVHSLRSPGQFMPFFIALAQFIAVFYQAISRGLRLIAAEDGYLEGKCAATNSGSFKQANTEEIMEDAAECTHNSKFLVRPNHNKEPTQDIELVRESGL